MVAEAVVGRDRLLADLVAWIEPARDGRGRVILLSGEPGIGKSTLADSLAERAAGFRIGRGWCSAAGMPAYWPWRRALTGLIPAVRFAGSSSPDDRDVLFAAVIEALTEATEHVPQLLLIEDIHWADPPSLVLMRALVEAAPTLPMALVLTARDDPLEASEAVRAALSELPTSVRRVSVPPLDDSSAAELVRGVAGSGIPATAVVDVVGRTGGNPFFVIEVARLLAAQGAAGAAAVPPGVREAVERRLARLPQLCHQVLAVAAMAGESAIDGREEIEPELVAAVLDLDESTVVGQLEVAARAGTVRLSGPGPATWRLAHALVREVLASALPATERARLHRRVAEALTDGTAEPQGGRAERLAYHWSQSSGPDARERAGLWMLTAADEAMQSLGFEQAVEYLRRARNISTVDTISTDLRLGAALRLAGDVDGARDTLLSAARQARAAGRSSAVGTAALALGGGIAGFEVATGDEEQLELLRTAESGLPAGDSPLRAALLARLSVALGSPASVRERRRLAEDAAAMAQRCGDPAVEVAALAALCDALSGPDFVDQRAASAARMLSLAGDRVSILLARRLALVAHLEHGRLSTVDADIEHYDRAAQATGVGLYLWLPAIWRGMRAMLTGDIPKAFEHAAVAQEIGARAGSTNAALLVFALRLHAHLANGTPEELADECRRILVEARGTSLPVTYLAAPAVLLLAAGEAVQAREILQQFRGTRAEDITADSEWLEGHWALAELAMRLDDRASATRLLDALRPYQSLWAVDGIGAGVFGVVAHQVGRLAAYLGRQREAAAALQQARDEYARAGTPRLGEQVREALERLGVPSEATAGASVGVVRREGRFWRLTWRDRVSTVADSKGMRDLAALLASPGRPVSALDLVEAAGGPAAAGVGHDLGPVLDSTARQAYKLRLVQLESDLAEAEASADLSRVERLRSERAMIADELAGALGLGGRSRSLGDPVDRARKAVTMRIRAAIRAIELADAPLGRHLRNAVKTGRMCVYEPDTEVAWQI